MDVRIAHGRHRVHQHAQIGPQRHIVRLIDRCIDRIRPRAGQPRQMSAGRGAQHRDPVRPHAELSRPAADQTNGPLRVLQGRVRARRPAVCGQAITQDKAGRAAGGEDASDVQALLVQHRPAIAAARDQQQGRAVGPLGPHHRHEGVGRVLGVAVAVGGIGRALGYDGNHRHPLPARRALGPQPDHLGRVRWRESLGRRHGRQGRRQGGSRRPHDQQTASMQIHARLLSELKKGARPLRRAPSWASDHQTLAGSYLGEIR
ncbi:hypothetical protein D3C86_692490 [compost metagenome]